MLFVTHDLGLLPELCDEVVVMESGEVRETGPVERVLSEPASDYTRMLVRCDPARVGEKTRRLPTRTGSADVPGAAWLGPADRIRRHDPPMLVVEGLDVTFRRRFLVARRLRHPARLRRACREGSLFQRRARGDGRHRRRERIGQDHESPAACSPCRSPSAARSVSTEWMSWGELRGISEHSGARSR